MAFTVVSKGTPLAGRLGKLFAAPSAAGGESAAAALRPAAAAAATAPRRRFNTEGAPLRRGNDGTEDSSDEDDVITDPRRCRLLFDSSDLLDPFSAPTSLGRLLGMMEDAAPESGVSASAASRRQWWVAKEDDKAVLLKVPMPGLGKEHVKVWAEQNAVVIKGEGDKESADDDVTGPPKYSRRIDLPTDAFKMDQIKAEMKNGVLKVTVPKLKEEDRKDVFQVKVE